MNYNGTGVSDASSGSTQNAEDNLEMENSTEINYQPEGWNSSGSSYQEQHPNAYATFIKTDLAGDLEQVSSGHKCTG
jgi:hypothetical protein